jgi:hypothetical protein
MVAFGGSGAAGGGTGAIALGGFALTGGGIGVGSGAAGATLVSDPGAGARGGAAGGPAGSAALGVSGPMSRGAAREAGVERASGVRVDRDVVLDPAPRAAAPARDAGAPDSPAP